MSDNNDKTVIKPKSSWGGARPGAGRKKGMTAKNLRSTFFEKLNLDNEVESLHEMWEFYKIKAMQKAAEGNTEDIQWILGRIMPVPKEQDITTNGESINGGVLPSITIAPPTADEIIAAATANVAK